MFIRPRKQLTSESDLPRVNRSAEPLVSDELFKKPYLTLNEFIDCLARHNVEICEEVAHSIEAFAKDWLSAPRMSSLENFLSPTEILEKLYRRWRAAGDLHYELMEHCERSPAWRNWFRTGQPARLDPDGTHKATSLLEAIAHDAEQRYQEILANKRALDDNSPSWRFPVLNDQDRRWLDCLGFETNEIFEFVRAKEPGKQDEGSAGEPPWIHTSRIVTLFDPKQLGQPTRNWARTFSNPPAGLKSKAQRSDGRGIEAVWDPVQIALWLHQKRKCVLVRLDNVFEMEDLRLWQQRWKDEAEYLRKQPGYIG